MTARSVSIISAAESVASTSGDVVKSKTSSQLSSSERNSCVNLLVGLLNSVPRTTVPYIINLHFTSCRLGVLRCIYYVTSRSMQCIVGEQERPNLGKCTMVALIIN